MRAKKDAIHFGNDLDTGIRIPGSNGILFMGQLLQTSLDPTNPTSHQPHLPATHALKACPSALSALDLWFGSVGQMAGRFRRAVGMGAWGFFGRNN